MQLIAYDFYIKDCPENQGIPDIQRVCRDGAVSMECMPYRIMFVLIPRVAHVPSVTMDPILHDTNIKPLTHPATHKRHLSIDFQGRVPFKIPDAAKFI